jgi:acyl-CoA dehydrogenase
MNFGHGDDIETLRAKLQRFMADHIHPNEKVWHAHSVSEQRWQPVPIIEELKLKARAAGLWNLWRPKSHGGTLSNAEYAPLCEIMGRVHWAPEVFIAPLPTPAIWKRCCVTARRNKSRRGASRCSTARSAQPSS